MRLTDISFLPAALAERVRQHPDASAYTFIDYDVDPAGYVETLTWFQVARRAQIVAAELASCGSPGDRVAICAPQGLDYIVGLFGVLQAGFIAVPLSVPMLGVHDERVAAVLTDSWPVAVLTTSAAVGEVVSYAKGLSESPPVVIEVDALDLDAPVELGDPGSPQTKTALLQYTSGSTRAPAGVVVTHRNLMTNLEQIMADYFEDAGGVPPADATLVSWLPFFHDMGLMFGIFIPAMFGRQAVLMSPMSFLQKPVRWMQLVAGHTQSVSPAPNFAYELAVRRASDEDMAGLDLGNVLSFISGAERVHPATIRRFMDRFSPFNLAATALRAAYGLAEATVYVASSNPGRPPSSVRFDYEKLAAGHANRCDDGDGGVELTSHGTPRACTIRIVDPDTHTEKPADEVGEIWVHGDNVAAGYWHNSPLTHQIFGVQLVGPSPGTPARPWLRTGDLGVICGGELFIVGRIKDLLVVDGRNHYPDDIEATIQELTGGRVAAVSVPADACERLVTVIEFKNKGSSDEDVVHRLRTVKRQVTAAVSKTHGVRVDDFVMVAPGSIPITTSGKIRRSACRERYRQDEFARLDGVTPDDEPETVH
jgi:long chain fatty acid CoA FadD26